MAIPPCLLLHVVALIFMSFTPVSHLGVSAAADASQNAGPAPISPGCNVTSQDATDRAILVLVLLAFAVAFLPIKFLLIMAFLEIFTRNSPPRRASSEKFMRRFREWWFSIPAAPFLLDGNDKKKK